ncbi:MAG: hypothetical protein NC081_03090 [Roseburia sp.]|nr:hypothetical protein [Roseburia sp.]
MHIAICDDNIADRKQMERLLKRESDKRASSTGILYADSFGNAEAMLANPRQYDVFYIDICKTENITVSEIVASLTAKGIEAPIILCCSDIDYRRQSFPENVTFLDKPIRTAELSASLDYAQQLIGQAPSLIELRDENNTIYVNEQDILYAVSKGRIVELTLTEGRIFQMRTEIVNLYYQWEKHESFLAPNAKTIINCRYLESFPLGRVRMCDGRTFSLSRSCAAYAKEMYAKYHT